MRKHTIMNINRLMSRRDKDGSSHRREKSRDKSADKEKDKSTDKKVTSHIWDPYLLAPFSTDAHAGIKPQHARSFSSLSKAFAGLGSKSSPLARLSQINVLGTRADRGSCFQSQSRPLSGDGLSSIFKTDPQKKMEKEQAKEHATKVCFPDVVLGRILTANRRSQKSRND